MTSNRFFRAWRALAAAVLLIAVQAAGAATVDEIIKRGKLLVAIDTNNPPWGQMDASMQPEGIDVGVAKLMAKYMGVPLEIVPVTSQNRIPFIVTGKADVVMATLTITPQRALQIWYSIPYALQDSVIMTASNSPIKSFEDLNGKKVSVVRGAIQDALVTRHAPRAQMQRFDNDASTIQALVTGQVDATATGFLIPAQTTKANPGKTYVSRLKLGTQHIGIGMKRDSADLLQWTNTFIYHIRSNGELADLFKQYFGMTLPELPSF
ncbi:transporter substrate-binding domain-containing protein [Variovorax paradoxus]|jgi:polar amino acid transport system substrate-binding protein|uniref:transporter substrate-binding domain-containing protein n=1 Tax=Variovorax paradoxus TaxID=34073 RepID=UPI0003650F0E|nr:transporter substrate-binding domain-containing protein [Variovorax paradoxus]